jgi:hypothetical protein
MKLKVFLPLALSVTALLLSPSCKKEIPNMDAYVYGKVYNQNSSDPAVGTLVLLRGLKMGEYAVNKPILDSAFVNELGEYHLSYQTEEEMSLYDLDIIGPNHIQSNMIHPSGGQISIHPGSVRELDLHIVPICWLRIHSVRISDADELFINPMAGGYGLLITEPNAINYMKSRGNELVDIPCFQHYPTNYIPFQVQVQTPTHDTVDVRIEW